MRWYIRDFDDGTIHGPFDRQTAEVNVSMMDNGLLFSESIFDEPHEDNSDISSIPKVVEIHIVNGVAEIVSVPSDVKVVLRDYDVEGMAEERLQKDVDGKSYYVVEEFYGED